MIWGGAVLVMLALGSGCKHRWSFACLPLISCWACFWCCSYFWELYSVPLICLFFSPILHCLDYHRFIVLKSYIVSPSTLIFSSNTVSTILALPICFLASSYFAYNVASIQCFPSAICSISSSLSHKLFPSL